MGAGHSGGGRGPARDGPAGRGPARADVEVLAGAFAVVEFELARRMHAATPAGSLPLVGPGAVLPPGGGPPRTPGDWPARGRWPPSTRPWRRRGRRGSSPVTMWTRSPATSARSKPDELAAVVEELAPLWGQLSPPAVAAFVARVIRLLHPPPDPDPDEVGRL